MPFQLSPDPGACLARTTPASFQPRFTGAFDCGHVRCGAGAFQLCASHLPTKAGFDIKFMILNLFRI